MSANNNDNNNGRSEMDAQVASDNGFPNDHKDSERMNYLLNEYPDKNVQMLLREAYALGYRRGFVGGVDITKNSLSHINSRDNFASQKIHVARVLQDVQNQVNEMSIEELINGHLI